MGALMRAAQGIVDLAWGVRPQQSQLPVPMDEKDLSPVSSQSGWLPIIREAFSGDWQKNLDVKVDTALTNTAVFRCISLIESDVGKMPCTLATEDENGIWTKTSNPAWSPVLRRPNHYQNSIQFFSAWVRSKLIHGNTYVLKARDRRNVVTQLHVLHPNRVTVLVAPNGDVYYELWADDLAGIPHDQFTVPASEIIHDRHNAHFHPLIGLSPITACGIAALNGLNIQRHSTQLFANAARPGGILTAPGKISVEQAERLKIDWETKYRSGDPSKVAVLGDGLRYEGLALTAHDSQLIEQLKFSSETIAMAFGVPVHKLGLADPKYDNIEAKNAEYYSQCLQIYIESIERCLDDGLELPKPYGTMFDLDYLLRMDQATAAAFVEKVVGAGVMSPNEARAKFDLKPKQGGDTPYMQQQNYSLAALDERDKTNPLAAPPPAPEPPNVDGEPPPEETQDDDGGDETRAYIEAIESIERAAQWYERSSAA